MVGKMTDIILRHGMNHMGIDRTVHVQKKPLTNARGLRGSVGMTGFEPATSSSRTKRATGLRYIPSGEDKFSQNMGHAKMTALFIRMLVVRSILATPDLLR